jgi:hypothetical protein
LKVRVNAKIGFFRHNIDIEFEGTLEELKEFLKLKGQLIQIDLK